MQESNGRKKLSGEWPLGPDSHEGSGFSAPNGEGSSQRGRCYAEPGLTAYGKLQDVTLGGSVGTGDSGSSDTRRPPGAPPSP